MGENASLCARCARQGNTCCQGTEIYVTSGDVARIQRAARCIGFYEFTRPANPAYLDQSDDPVWQAHVFRKDGTRRVLRHQPTGDCTFLTPGGCLLTLETRPLVCRLYPLSYNDQGFYTEPETGCPVGLLPPGASLMDALCLSIAAARRWHRQLYKEIRHECDDHRPDLRSAG